MDQINRQVLEQLLITTPGGIAKLAFDDMLTILYATDTFYTLIKNVSDKISIKSPLALLRMVYSADIIYVTQQLASQKHRKDNMICFNFRTLQHDGSFRWVMVTGNKTEETYTAGDKAVPVYSCIAMDVTDIMVKYKKLEQTNDYHSKITELSRDLYFEYEIATDTLTFSELFRELFGKDSVITGFRKKLEKTKIIHPEELPAIVKIFNSVMSGRKQVRFELRLITKEGVPNWYTCYASIIFDENRTPFKVVGKISVLNQKLKEIEKQVLLPDLDSLTMVCTKESAEQLIAEAAGKQEENCISALFLVEIRNYKAFSEIRKSLNEENILTNIGGILKKLFRTSDIIGRTGLNEFIIYMKDIPADKAAYDIADSICMEIEAIHSYKHTRNISVSIGIAFQYGPQEYHILRSNANTALVMAKKEPTSSFEIFNQTVN